MTFPSSWSRSPRRWTTSNASPEESLVLIVDIGGGTSDFTVVRLGPDRMKLRDRAKTSSPPPASTSAARTTTRS
jgi:hypothetical protein